MYRSTMVSDSLHVDGVQVAARCRSEPRLALAKELRYSGRSTILAAEWLRRSGGCLA